MRVHDRPIRSNKSDDGSVAFLSFCRTNIFLLKNDKMYLMNKK
jgi:hypothetical protein